MRPGPMRRRRTPAGHPRLMVHVTRRSARNSSHCATNSPRPDSTSPATPRRRLRRPRPRHHQHPGPRGPRIRLLLHDR
ncbi:hypothetical protein IOD13_16360 [Brevibacterium casei]|nr:hypothetical protein [Brevibacterium casei]